MRLVVSFTTEAIEHVEKIEEWWRLNREKALDLFREELPVTFSRLSQLLSMCPSTSSSARSERRVRLSARA
jgi:hypothetical protein